MRDSAKPKIPIANVALSPGIPDERYRTRTPYQTKKTGGIRSASPSAFKKGNIFAIPTYSTMVYNTMTNQTTNNNPYNGSQRQGRVGSQGMNRAPLHERSGNAYGGTASSHGAYYGPNGYAVMPYGADPSYRTFSGVPIKGAASTDYSKTTMPKHFTQPLTCFYWHKNGYCTKNDDDCL